MKKTIWIIVMCLCLFAALAAWALSRGASEPAPGPGETPEPAETAAAAAPIRHVDMEKLRKAYDRDAVYARIGEREITWGEYYDLLGVDIVGLESYMNEYASPDNAVGWDSITSDGDSLAAQVVDELNDTLRIYAALDSLAAEHGAEISEEELDARIAEYRTEAVGANGSDEAWTAWLSKNFVSEGIFRRNIRYTMIYSRLPELLYGAGGEKLSAARLQHFIEDQDLMRFRFLCFLTSDPVTGAALDPAEADAIRVRAEETVGLLLEEETKDARLAAFDAAVEALQAEDADRFYGAEYVTSAAALPDLYVNALRPLKDYDYQMSGLTSDDYGIYLFLRLPVEASSVLADGTTVGAQAAHAAFSELLQEEMENCHFVCAEGCAPIDLLSWLED